MLRKTIGQSLRSLGKSLERVGVRLEGRIPYIDHPTPTTRLVRNAGNIPTVAANVFVAPNASVIGDVHLGQGSSVWYGATLRGDINLISIGAHTNIQDQAIVHVAKIHQDIPTKVGTHVTVGPTAILHACTVHNHCLIGTGAQVLDGAEVEDYSIITDGAIVTYNKKVPMGQVWSGVPARFVREVTTEERVMIDQKAKEYEALAAEHAVECNKLFE